MKHVYTAYRARSMCPICANEEEVFITNNGIFPSSTKTCPNCSHSYPANEFICNFMELKGNSTVSSSSTI
jgi:RNA polymerase subunit RPABC4/transcription elongation factor Spt4